MSDEEKNAVKLLNNMIKNKPDTIRLEWRKGIYALQTLLNLIEKQQKEIEELKETLKCTQNSWYEDTQKIEEMKKQIDLDNECEIALNSKVMNLEKEIEEIKDTSNKFYYEWKHLEAEVINNYISKDKIKAKIEELEIEQESNRENLKIAIDNLIFSNMDKISINMSVRDILQSLLKEE